MKIKEILNRILDRFTTGNLPHYVRLSLFPITNIPANKWSFLNRIIMFGEETEDARGFRQWKEVGRFVKKGAKAFYILTPRIKKVKDEEKDDEKRILVGYRAVPVFRAEDTEGEPLEYEKIDKLNLPLLERAEEWGIKVKTIMPSGGSYGYYQSGRHVIGLASKDEVVFFHELSHVAHEKIIGYLRPGQDWQQEIVAELSASVLCELVGKDGSKYLGHSYKYIESYAQKENLTAVQGCLKVINDTEKVLNLILKISNDEAE